MHSSKTKKEIKLLTVLSSLTLLSFTYAAQLYLRCSALPKLLSSPYTAQLCLHVSALLVKAEHITVKLSTRPAKLRNTLQSSAMLRDAYDAQ